MPKKAATPDPDKLTRQQAGTYRTADERFEIREADTGWFLVDSRQTNEFGQELMLGPFATLKAAREVLPEARKAEPIRRARPASRKPSRTEKAKRPPPPSPPPPSWIDQLDAAEARAVRGLIKTLERHGMPDAEPLVRRDREGLFPAVATRRIEQRLEALVDERPKRERAEARALVRRVAEVLSAEGSAGTGHLPGWWLVEVGGAEPDPPNRRIDLRG